MALSKQTCVDAYIGRTFYHATARNADGTAARCRKTGVTKTWKRDLARFCMPVKHGLRNCFYITPANANDWLEEDPTIAERVRSEECERLGVSDSIPDWALRDLAQEMA